MKLYYSKGACSLAIRITLNEIGAPCEFEAADIKTKQTESGHDFLKINPKGAVPVLVTDKNEILTENVAIQQYLADTFNATQLLPPLKDIQRYRVLEWLSYVATDLHKTCGPLFNPAISADIKAAIFHPILKIKLDFVDKQLANKQFLTGDNFTVADSYLFVILSWLPYFKINIEDWENLSKYKSTLLKRESVKQALMTEGFLAVA